jgi:hypothetical protein
MKNNMSDKTILEKYRILKSTYYDEYGEEKNEYHYIQQRKSFLGIKYWKDITHTIGGMGGDYKQTTRFETYFDAYEFCVKLKSGMKVDGWKTETVNYI